VTARGEPPQQGTVAGLVGFAELCAEVGQLIDPGGCDSNQPVGQPGSDRRFAQCFDLGTARDVACVFQGRGELVAGRGEVLGLSPYSSSTAFGSITPQWRVRLPAATWPCRNCKPLASWAVPRLRSVE
jgi:hypothetical protein